MVLNENDFKTLLMCPKKFSFEKDAPSDPELIIFILNKILSKINLYFLKNKTINKDIVYQILLNVFIKESQKMNLILPAEKTSILNSIILNINDSLKAFNIEDYIPVFGPFILNKKLSNSVIKLKINGIYRSLKKQTLHIVMFSSYKNKHSVINDPTTSFKIEELVTLVPQHYTKRTRVFAHVFYFKNNTLAKEIISSENTTANDYTQLLALAESGTYYPVLPCTRKCKYKKICV